MSKLHKLKIHGLILLTILFLLECRPKEKNDSFNSIEGYFAKKKWAFPIEVLDSTLSTKYYPDTSSLLTIPNDFENSIQEITRFYRNPNQVRMLLQKIATDTSDNTRKGFTVSKPTIVIDTSVYGSIKKPKFYLSFNISTYKINRDSASRGIPCEDCILEENKKIIRYPHGIFFELNKTKDSLVFSRWD